jgi:predicted O-methyltransferase YrrM/uncharacterized damage-inducible protein DinB/catechol 2,3-dioxygenase-like lactoylglutathione lyase family enzyme
MPSITRVYETILYAPELGAMEAFYAGVLGLEPLPRTGDRGAVFRVNDESVLIVFDALKTRAPHEQVPSHGATGEGHVALSVPDLDEWRARLSQRGIAIEREVEWPLGGRSLYVRDPAGNSVELVYGRVWNIPVSEKSQQAMWNAVDRALEGWLAPADEALTRTITSAARAGLPEIAVAPAQGRLLEVLARAIGARRILEVGTLAGYSAIWLARALPPGGELVTLELDPDRARLARENIDGAGPSASVEVMTGPAAQSLDTLIAAGVPPFDLVFIDADKASCPQYLERAVALSRPGSVIIVDNVILRGRVIEAGTGDPSVDGVRTMMDLITRHPRLHAAGIQTVGAKGYDGLLVAVVKQGAVPPARSADPLDLLLGHDAWGTGEVLRACAGLSEEQWHRRFDIGPGSLHDTLTHIVGAMLRWADRIDGPPRALRPTIENGTRRTPAEIRTLLDGAAADLAASTARARQRGLGTQVDITLGGTPYRFTLGAMLVHVTTHGMHHRAQCLNMLRRLAVPGVSDQLPDLDALEWQLKAGVAPTAG